MNVVHVQTLITTTFGVVDDEGNVILQQPIQAQLVKFDEASFAEAYRGIAEHREKAAAVESGRVTEQAGT